jgi:DNA repair ATPase RecN
MSAFEIALQDKNAEIEALRDRLARAEAECERLRAELDYAAASATMAERELQQIADFLASRGVLDNSVSAMAKHAGNACRELASARDGYRAILAITELTHTGQPRAYTALSQIQGIARRGLAP